MKRTVSYLLLSCSLFTVAACSSTGNSIKETARDMPNHEAQSNAPYLMAFTWKAETLESQNQAAYKPETPFSLEFYNANAVSVQGLCNTLNAGYQVQQNKVLFHSPVGTLKMCNNPALMALESHVGATLNGDANWHISQLSEPLANASPQLQLNFANGERWTLLGTATPETQYGSQGETIFLEVQAKRQRCYPPFSNNTTCLMVREVVYGENGVRTHNKEWSPLYTHIDGYEHDDNVATVLRVKRYRIANPPADASSIALHLDMVVSQEVVE